MADQFREAEATYNLLRERFEQRKISAQEFADSLKQLRIKDEQGRFWVIGAQSGNWYAFENGEWVEAKPPSQMEKKAICIHCGFENDLEAEVCARCGGRAASSAPDELAGAEAALAGASGERLPARPGTPITVRSLDILSFLWFFGILGLFAGLLGGLLTGGTSLFSGFVARLPGFFVEHHGDLWGGLASSILGGILGFVCGAAAGAFLALVSNGILSLTGGLKLRRS
jgi:hypothetical protein